MNYSVRKSIKELTPSSSDHVFDFELVNSFGVVVGVFHDKNLALEVRDFLNDMIIPCKMDEDEFLEGLIKAVVALHYDCYIIMFIV